MAGSSGRRCGSEGVGTGSRIVAIVLAAGRSTRFGTQKLISDAGGRPLVRRTVVGVLDSAVDGVTVVTGADAQAVRAALGGLDVDFVHNLEYGRGMGSSIATGVRSLGAEVDAVVIVLGDQPTSGGPVLDTLISAYRSCDRPIVVPEFAGVRTPPVLFGRALFARLAGLSGDRGARRITEVAPELVAVVSLAGPPPPDIDTRADLQALDES